MLIAAIVVFSLYTVKQVEALQYDNFNDFYESLWFEKQTGYAFARKRRYMGEKYTAP